MEYTFNYNNAMTSDGLSLALSEQLKRDEKPIIVCVGTDLAVGDCLGPLIGSLLKLKSDINAFIYGTLEKPVTAKEVKYLNYLFRRIHPNNKIIVIDASLGRDEDIGLIKIYDSGLKPGLGVGKDFSTVGNISIVGIVATKTFNNLNLFNQTRLSMIYDMALKISSGIASFFSLSDQATA